MPRMLQALSVTGHLLLPLLVGAISGRYIYYGMLLIRSHDEMSFQLGITSIANGFLHISGFVNGVIIVIKGRDPKIGRFIFPHSTLFRMVLAIILNEVLKMDLQGGNFILCQFSSTLLAFSFVWLWVWPLIRRDRQKCGER